MASTNKAGAINKVFFTKRASKPQELYWFKKQTKNTVVSLRPVQDFCLFSACGGCFFVFCFLFVSTGSKHLCAFMCVGLGMRERLVFGRVLPKGGFKKKNRFQTLVLRFPDQSLVFSTTGDCLGVVTCDPSVCGVVGPCYTGCTLLFLLLQVFIRPRAD